MSTLPSVGSCRGCEAVPLRPPAWAASPADPAGDTRHGQQRLRPSRHLRPADVHAVPHAFVRDILRAPRHGHPAVPPRARARDARGKLARAPAGGPAGPRRRRVPTARKGRSAASSAARDAVVEQAVLAALAVEATRRRMLLPECRGLRLDAAPVDGHVAMAQRPSRSARSASCSQACSAPRLPPGAAARGLDRAAACRYPGPSAIRPFHRKPR